jgi:hypothetical protein
MAVKLTQLDILNLLKVLDDKPIEQHFAEKLTKRGLCRIEGDQVFVSAQGTAALKKVGIDHSQMKTFGQSLSPKGK